MLLIGWLNPGSEYHCSIYCRQEIEALRFSWKCINPSTFTQRDAYKSSDAKSASGDRSPFSKVTCA